MLVGWGGDCVGDYRMAKAALNSNFDLRAIEMTAAIVPPTPSSVIRSQ
jgi:hypothetical protein